MMKRLFGVGVMTVALTLGVAAPATTAAAAPNGSQLANCVRTAAERLAAHAQSGNEAKARRQFNRDVARCHRRFG